MMVVESRRGARFIYIFGGRTSSARLLSDSVTSTVAVGNIVAHGLRGGPHYVEFNAYCRHSRWGNQFTIKFRRFGGSQCDVSPVTEQ